MLQAKHLYCLFLVTNQFCLLLILLFAVIYCFVKFLLCDKLLLGKIADLGTVYLC